MKTTYLISKCLIIIGFLLQGCTDEHESPSGITSLGFELSPDVYADIVFYNGTVITMTEALPIAQAIAIKAGKILGVGTNKQAMGVVNKKTKVFDLKGKTVMPGIVDAHTHIFNDRDKLGLNMHQAQQLALENGITTLGNLYCHQDFVEEMYDFEPDLKVKTSLYLIKTDPCGTPQDDWYLSYPVTRIPGEMLRVNGIKINADGGVCGAMAVSEEFVPGTTGLGDLWHTQDELNEMVENAHTAGYQVAIHAIGDRAIEQAQNAIANALDGAPNRLRHRIEHNGAIRPDLINRYGEIGILPIIFGFKRICDFLPRSEFYKKADFPYRSLIKANPGLRVAWHGDDPWIGPVNPFIELHSMVTRTEISETGEICYPPDWLAAQSLDVKTALKLMTINSAYALFRDEEVGSLEPKKYADLLVISDNPLSIDPQKIKDIQVLLTLINGKKAYSTASEFTF